MKEEEEEEEEEEGEEEEEEEENREKARERACRKVPRGQERRKCPLRPLSSFEIHERLKRTERRQPDYSLPFLLSRGVLPFPVEARNKEPLHGPFTITIIVDSSRQKERMVTARLPPPCVGRWGTDYPTDPSSLLSPRPSFSSLLDAPHHRETHCRGTPTQRF